MPDQACRFFDLSERNPADRLHRFGRVFATKPRVKLEGRVAHDLAISRDDAVFAFECQIESVAVVAPGAGIERHQMTRCLIPGEQTARIAAGREIAFGQQPTGIGSHQMWAVAPVANKLTVVPAALDHQICYAESECATGAGSNSEPNIGLGCEPDMTRVNND